MHLRRDRSTLAVRCNRCDMRVDHAGRQATSCWPTFRSRKDVAKLGPRVHQSIIHLMLVGGGGDRCWTSWATCIADFELARAGKPKFSKGRAARPRATPERSLALALRALRALTCNVVFQRFQYHYFDCLGGEGLIV